MPAEGGGLHAMLQTLGDSRAAEYMKGRKTLEINPEHPIVRALKEKVDSDEAGAKVGVNSESCSSMNGSLNFSLKSGAGCCKIGSVLARCMRGGNSVQNLCFCMRRPSPS